MVLVSGAEAWALYIGSLHPEHKHISSAAKAIYSMCPWDRVPSSRSGGIFAKHSDADIVSWLQHSLVSTLTKPTAAGSR